MQRLHSIRIIDQVLDVGQVPGAPNENIVQNHLNIAFKRILVFKR